MTEQVVMHLNEETERVGQPMWTVYADREREIVEHPLTGQTYELEFLHDAGDYIDSIMHPFDGPLPIAKPRR